MSFGRRYRIGTSLKGNAHENKEWNHEKEIVSIIFFIQSFPRNLNRQNITTLHSKHHVDKDGQQDGEFSGCKCFSLSIHL